MKWCFDHDVQWWDDSCPASRDECDEGCDVDVLIRAGDRVLYEIDDISTREAFVTSGLMAINARSGVHEGVLVQVYPEVT